MKPPLTAADWLRFTASPTFAAMALLASAHGSDMICITGPSTSPLSGMVPMYLLMSLFHSAPWLKLLARTRPQSKQGQG